MIMEPMEIRTINVAVDTEPPLMMKVHYDVASARGLYPDVIDWVRDAPFMHLGERAVWAVEAVVLGWDIQEDDGKPYVPSPDNMAKMPIFVLSRVIEGIAADIQA